ncbi:ABC transporter ATP-binding protein [Mariniblastus fucicola]|uniref:Putative ABC transporter ATP-binding protein n=1 Tax=Mariniblastus fucicola TaxID=980251 RepID=A0A5B9PEJ5_9BACT|nr:ABC transporter ATP-binding protein [Mariniblastus fucicola]QEG23605.1 putative ABC transporter ATP-binding protein [Mariniblastus fucicola]
MINFLRVIKLSLVNKWKITALLVNSLIIGLLWGCSISAVYPFVEVVFSGNTIETWLVSEIEKTDEKIAELQITCSDLKLKVGDSGNSTQLRNELDTHSRRLIAEEKANQLYRTVMPWIEGRVPQTPFGTLVFVMSTLIMITIIKGVCLVLNSVLVAQIAQRTALVMRRQFYSSAVKMDQLTIDQKGTSAMQTMLIYNLNLVTAGLISLYGKGTREPLKMLVCLVLAACISWKLLLLTMVVAPIAGFVINRISQHMRTAAQRELGGIAGVLQSTMESLSALRTVRIFNRERTEKARFNRFSKTLYNLGVKQAFFDSLLRPTTELAGMVCVAIALLAGGYLVLNDTTHLLGVRMSDRPMTVSSVFLFFAMLAGISEPARKMSEIYNTLVRADVSSKGLYDFFEVEPEIQTPKNPSQLPLHSKGIRFKSVNFAYNLKQITLKRLDLIIPFGQTVALIGPNGSGKSTLINLLARFYDPQWGAVLIDGVDIKNVNPRHVRKQMAMVTQDPVLFKGTVLENIQYGNMNATSDDILRAAEMARVTDFLDVLPKGFDTMVGDRGNTLSGGQRQRIALARAIVADPRILFLDEATSQVDVASEQLIHDSLKQFLKQRTTIIISHRPATLEIADRVIVLEQGQIEEDLSSTEYFERYGIKLDRKRVA